MGLPDKEKGAPKAEERTSVEEHATSSAGEREGADQHVVGGLSYDEKQQLFIKKLYRLSQAHIDETPEEERAQRKTRATPTIASPLSHPTTTAAAQEEESVTPPQSPLVSFASQLSEMTSCVTMDYLCTGRETEPSKREVEKKKKKSPLQKPDIPETITLEPSNVSRLEDDDSLSRHINALARKTPQPTIYEEDDESKNSPQCVAELSYEMEISRIIPVEEKPKKRKHRFGKTNTNRSASSLEPGEMEF